jgi:hypothetical protein
MADWYFGRDGQHTGPISFEELQRVVSTGRVLPSDQVWHDGLDEWTAAENLSELSSAIEEASTKIWYYGNTGKHQGPASVLQLRDLIASGNVTGDHLVWKEGMDEWTAISELAEFEDALEAFGPHTDSLDQGGPADVSRPPEAAAAREHEPDRSSPGGPPPVPPRSPESSAGSQVANSFSALKANAAAAGQLVTKKAQRTKIAQVKLPSAYREFGRQVFESGQHREDFPEQHAAIDQLEAKLQKGEAGSGLVDTKFLQVKRSRAFASLGKVAYGKFPEGTPQSDFSQAISGISQHRKELETLDAEIEELSQAGQGHFLTPKRIAVGGSVVIALVLFSFLKSLWTPDWREEYSAKNEKTRQEIQKQLDDAEVLWAADQKADAVDIYDAILSGKNGYWMAGHEEGQLPKLFRRVIDFRIEQGGVEAARDQIALALRWDVSLSLSTPEANEFVAKVRAEREKNIEEDRRRYEQESVSAADLQESVSAAGAEHPLLRIDDDDLAGDDYWHRAWSEGARYGGNMSEDARNELVVKLEKAHQRERSDKAKGVLNNRKEGLKNGWRSPSGSFKGDARRTLEKAAEEIERRRREGL